MAPLLRLVLCAVMLTLLLCHAGTKETVVVEEEGGDMRAKRDIPNWALSSSDFFGWVEELRKHAGYEKMDELARVFWAHFPSADRLGYGTHEQEE